MLPKYKYPQLNRAARRHPQRWAREQSGKLNKGWLAGGNWLLAGLMIRAGYTPRVSEEGAQV